MYIPTYFLFRIKPSAIRKLGAKARSTEQKLANSRIVEPSRITCLGSLNFNRLYIVVQGSQPDSFTGARGENTVSNKQNHIKLLNN